TSFPRLDWRMYPQFTFEKPQLDTFKNLALAFEALHRGGNTCCVLNGANEVAVQAFLKDQIGFVQMSQIIEKCMAKVNFIAQPTLSDLLASDQEARLYANEYIKN
ncbi:MAG: 1-deoxy-D-xylulose-5-phosphate reductoisomerase, partial [Bacteroidales bacterium]